ncbi:MAG: DUF1080 domain-containing protein [Planctomycetota bacterium]|nr:DUF1080 domain-containing protein [Planctomycetota bacterium]
MKKTTRLFVVGLTALAIGIGVGNLFNLSAEAGDPNSLSEDEEKAGFELVFNGTDLSGWKHGGNWKVEDGAATREGSGGNLTFTTKKVPDDFELRFQWNVGKGSNSGIYYRPGQYEYQILDNDVHIDGKNPRTSAASVYFCMAPSKDVTKPVGEWNEGRIVCKGRVIQHWLNGEKVIDFDYADKEWAFNVDLLKKRGADLAARGGSLYLQDHGDPVWYRAIKLRAIPQDEDIGHKTVQPAKISDEVLEAERKKLEGIVQRREDARKKAAQE